YTRVGRSAYPKWGMFSARRMSHSVVRNARKNRIHEKTHQYVGVTVGYTSTFASVAPSIGTATESCSYLSRTTNAAATAHAARIVTRYCGLNVRFVRRNATGIIAATATA